MKRLTANKGDKFGDLLVLGPAPSQFGKQRVYLRCTCGTVVERFVANLYKQTAYVRSCGCAKKKYGSRRRAQDKPYKDDGIFSQTAQDFYLGQLTR